MFTFFVDMKKKFVIKIFIQLFVPTCCSSTITLTSGIHTYIHSS